MYKKRRLCLYLPEPKFNPIVWDEKIPKSMQNFYKGELVWFVDAAYVNEPTNRRSATGFPLNSVEVKLFTGIKLSQSIHLVPRNQSLLML